MTKGFVEAASEFNKKRSRLIMKELERIVDELYSEEDMDKKEAILETLRLPSGKEWKKQIHRLIKASLLSGADRAEKEIIDLMKRAPKFDEGFPATPKFDSIDYKETLRYLELYSFELAGYTDRASERALFTTFYRAIHYGHDRKTLMADIQAALNSQMSKSRLENIARTESIKFYNAGRVKRYTDPKLDGFVQGLQYDSIIDARTTNICNELDGMVVSIKDQATIDKFTPPNHFQCRATWLPVTKYEDVEFNFDPSHEPMNGFGGSVNIDGGRKNIDDNMPLEINKLSRDQIRALSDDDFRNNIGKITDDYLRDELRTERIEQMLIETGALDVGDLPAFKMRAADNYATVTYGDNKVRLAFLDKNSPKEREIIRKELKLLKTKEDYERFTLGYLLEKYPDANWFGVAEDVHALAQIVNGAAVNSVDISKLVIPPKGKLKLDLLKNSHNVRIIESPKRNKRENNYWSRFSKEELDKSLEWIADNVHRKNIYRTNVNVIIDLGRDRSYAQGAQIVMRYTAYSDVYTHELAHIMHFNSDRLKREVKTFFNRRTEKDRTIREIYPGEHGVPDNFFTPYVGRVYEFEGGDPGGQEVLSMGFEAMQKDPKQFYKNDPDHFKFILGIMQGFY